MVSLSCRTNPIHAIRSRAMISPQFSVVIVLSLGLLLNSGPSSSSAINAFQFNPYSVSNKRSATHNIPPKFGRISPFLQVSTDVNQNHDGNHKNNQQDDNADNNSHVEMSDDELLSTVPESQFQDLCQQLGLSTQGTKMELLLRLRQHADEQAKLEEKRCEERKLRVEEGANEDERERHEIVDGEMQFGPSMDDDDEEEEEGYFYFELPTTGAGNDKEKTTKAETKNSKKTTTKNQPMTQDDILTPPPPPPDAPIDEDGNRVVTVYSTTDHNDLTGVAAAQPGQAAMSGADPMSAGSSSYGRGSQAWDMDRPEQTNKVATSKELDQAKDKVTELVQILLAMTGAPAFSHFDMPEELEDIMQDNQKGDGDELDSYTSSAVSSGYSPNGNRESATAIGFDPSKVPTHLLAEASQSLRANRGQVLQEVLREFELHAIGQDGRNGDMVEDGGGHYKEVSKVRAFLEGYRRAEVRKASRVTVTFLLDKLVSEGLEGLDMCLATMARSNDDSASEIDSYELNDSLVSYLNDIIREQEKKVERFQMEKQNEVSLQQIATNDAEDMDDLVNQLWNQTTGEDGESIESIDPKDPKVQRILKDELDKVQAAQASESIVGQKDPVPEAVPEKMLLLLKLLRERVKTEAAFPNDERSRNLRLLAYCLKCSSEEDREELIMKYIGSSIDKLDSFLELIASSIEYVESTSFQLQPAKRMPLNVHTLKKIQSQTESIRELQAWKASGLRP